VSAPNQPADRHPIRYAVVGCGRVGITWARQLAAVGGVPVGFVSRRRSSARAALAAAGGGQVFENLATAVAQANLVLITTPDDRIEATGRELAAARALKSGSIVLHCSGALDADTLAAVREGGAHAGSLHPLQSFASPVLERNPFQGIVMAGEGDMAAVALGEDLADRLEARFIRLPAGTKTLYHAAAVTASNYLVALLGGALEMLSACGLDARDAFGVLAPLVRGTLANIDRMGIPEALTGPIARGDATTVERHCRGLAAQRPALLRLYRVLGEYTLAVAQTRGELDALQIEALHALLADVPDD
jgi:predicted short-subunit dehydrogenase-like oxidoreductase (DUF2520 family)